MGEHLRPPRCWIAQSRPLGPGGHGRRIIQTGGTADSRSSRSARLVADSSAALDPISIFVAVATHDPMAVLVTATAPAVVTPELQAKTGATPAAVPVPITVSAPVSVVVAVTIRLR